MDANAEKNQEVFNTLSDLEEFFYYKLHNPEELSPYFGILMEMHASAKELVRQWHNLTGCKNQ